MFDQRIEKYDSEFSERKGRRKNSGRNHTTVKARPQSEMGSTTSPDQVK